MTRWTEILRKNRLIDQGDHVHLNRRALGLVRNELGNRGQEIIDDIQRGGVMVTDLIRKVSKRSLRSTHSKATCVEEEHDDESRSTTLDAALTQNMKASSHIDKSGAPLVERDCFMGQSVPEEEEELSAEALGGPESDSHKQHHLHGYASHVVSKAQPFEGFEKQNVKGSSTQPASIV